MTTGNTPYEIINKIRQQTLLHATQQIHIEKKCSIFMPIKIFSKR